MKLADYLEFSGVEIANAVRTDAYVANGLAGRGFNPMNCECDPVNNGPYVSPATDDAPWYTLERPESAQFLGLRVTRIYLDAVAIREPMPRFDGGSSLGGIRIKHRTIGVEGVMLATTDSAMMYGERWLADVLAGFVVGCAQDTIRLLLACGNADSFRTLRRVGVVDGPVYGPIGEQAPECVIQRVAFQLVAGVPYLLTDPVECLAATVLTEGS